MNKILIAIFCLCFMVACKSDESENKKTVDLEDQKDKEGSDEPKNDVVYMIPSPNEQYDLLQMLGGEVDPMYVNKLSRMSSYTSKEKKALNFGIYLSDAAYMTRYNQGKKVFLDYVSTLDKMGRELDISQVYGEDFMKKVEETDADSEKLFELSSKSYLQVFDQMIENEKGKELSLILSGAWIETMYIMFQSAGEFDNEYEIQEAIADERFVLENLLGFISNYEEHESVQNIQANLRKVEKAYENLDCKETKVEVKKAGDDSLILDGGDSCIFTEQSYNQLKELITEIRSSIIS